MSEAVVRLFEAVPPSRLEGPLSFSSLGTTGMHFTTEHSDKRPLELVNASALKTLQRSSICFGFIIGFLVECVALVERRCMKQRRFPH